MEHAYAASPNPPATVHPPRPRLVGLAGGSGSGKTTLANAIRQRLGVERTRIVSFDAYYRDLAHLPLAERARTNFDHPDSLDADLLAHHLDELRLGRAVGMPSYDFAQHTRGRDVVLVDPTDVIIVEGILLFSFPQLVERFDLRVFRTCAEDLRFERRLARDVRERGRTPISVTEQFAATVQPMHDRYVAPAAELADVVVPGDDLEGSCRAVLAGLGDPALV